MPDFSQNFNRYAYCLNNPLIYTDPSREFLTWSIGKNGFSIGFNLTPIGIPLGAGINIGGGDGGSAGVYGEVGYRVGGTGFGAGATVSQSLDYGFMSSSWSTTTSAGVYGSLGMFNAGGSLSYNHTHNSWGWGVSAGFNLFGTDAWGLGLNIGYGSGGWDFGLGGYYNPWLEYYRPNYEPEKWNDDGNTQLNNNCYSYALDDPDNPFGGKPQPGQYSGYDFIASYDDITFENVLSLALRDGRVKIPTAWDNFLYKAGVRRGYYVYLAVGDNCDYHWYRQDKGGLWSHKRGSTQVINYDAGKHLISNRNYYGSGGCNYNNGILLWRRR
jgi:hypothetical protein